MSLHQSGICQCSILLSGHVLHRGRPTKYCSSSTMLHINIDSSIEAIQFNIETCASVNESAPAFVGCSPLGLASSVILGSQGTSLSSTQASAGSSSSISTNVTPTNSLPTITITGVGSVLTDYIGATPVTVTYNGNALLTGTCTVPFFAVVTDSSGDVIQFPEIGCSHDQEGCCPFQDSHENAILTKCPQDYFTTAGACCPS